MNKTDFTRVLTQKEDILNSGATTPKTDESKEAQINKVQDDMTGEGRVHDTREEEDICPTCNRRVEENETAVLCDCICQRLHHLSCAELQLGQFNALKTLNKRKSKLLWLCYGCEQDFIFFKAGKRMQQELEGMRAEMNMTINEIIATINKLTSDHQTRAFVRNQPAVEQNVQTDEVRGTVITTSKDTTKEKTGPQKSEMHGPNKQMEIGNEERVGGETESNAQTG